MCVGKSQLLLSSQNVRPTLKQCRRQANRNIRRDNLFEKFGGVRGPYALQAAIAACHARALNADETDWARIVALYEVLGQVTPSPIVELNRAVAVAMAVGPAAGLELIDTLVSEPSLQTYHLLPSVRGDFLFKLGRLAEAHLEFERAASLARNSREREFLLDRARACAV